MITLTSSDEQSFEVSREAAMMSGLISLMLSTDGERNDAETDGDEGAAEPEVVIPLPNVEGEILRFVVEYCTHHAGKPLVPIPKPLAGFEFVDAWDASFIRRIASIPSSSIAARGESGDSTQTVFALILAANYLDISSLLDLACAHLAMRIKGKTDEEVRREFNIREDFDPSEFERLVNENRAWIEE